MRTVPDTQVVEEPVVVTVVLKQLSEVGMNRVVSLDDAAGQINMSRLYTEISDTCDHLSAPQKYSHLLAISSVMEHSLLFCVWTDVWTS